MIGNARTPTERRVARLHEFLKQVAAQPSKYASDTNLVSALARQTRLGKYENAIHGVKRSSHSSIRRASARLLAGGFPEFDALRVKVLNQLKAAIAAKERLQGHQKRTNADLRAQLADNDYAKMQDLQDNLQLTTALHRAITAARNAVVMAGNTAAIEYWNREEQIIRSMLTLCKKFVVRSASAEEKWAKELKCIR